MDFLDRRQFLKFGTAAFAGTAMSPRLAHAGRQAARPGATDPDQPAPGFYRFTLGNLEITVLNDGVFHLPGHLPIDAGPHEFQALNVDAETREAYFRARMVPSDDLPLEASPVVIDTGRQRVLVDSGWADVAAPPTTGRLGAALEAAEIPLDSIDLVVLTHGHPDHLGGLVDPSTRTPRFPNAEVALTDVELELWTDDEAEARFRDFPLPLPQVQEVFAALDDRLRPLGVDDEVVGGIRTIASPGHTQGHISLAVEGGGQALLLTGDAIATIHVAFERPAWQNLFDHEPERAAETRRRLLDRAASDEMLILGYHFPFPGLGYALRDGQAFRYFPTAGTALT